MNDAFCRCYRPQAYLAEVIDELEAAWDDRFSPANELPHVFGRRVTGAIDTFPIIINRPSKGNQQRHFYNGKYACHVVKVRDPTIASILVDELLLIVNHRRLRCSSQVQGVCDHRGNIICTAVRI